MKKIVSMFLCISMAIGLGCMVTGCGNDEVLKRIDDLQTQNTQLAEKLDEMQSKLDEQNEIIEELKSKTTQGVFYTVREAYENGYITFEDVKSIAYYHNHGRRDNEQIMPEDYKPIPKSPEVLTEKMQRPIKQTAWEYEYGSYRDNINPLKVTPSGFRIVEYNGIYNNCIAVVTEYGDGSGDGSGEYLGWEDEIEGVIITYADEVNVIRIWKEI